MSNIRKKIERQGLLHWIGQETQLARVELREGRFQRVMALLAAGSAIVSGWETYMQHQRGAFRNRWMWTPVWLTLPMVGPAWPPCLVKKPRGVCCRSSPWCR